MPLQKSTIPLKTRIRKKNQKYYKANREKILRNLFYRDIMDMRTRYPNRQTIQRFGLNEEMCEALKTKKLKTSLTDEERSSVILHFDNLSKFVSTRQKQKNMN